MALGDISNRLNPQQPNDQSKKVQQTISQALQRQQQSQVNITTVQSEMDCNVDDMDNNNNHNEDISSNSSSSYENDAVIQPIMDTLDDDDCTLPPTQPNTDDTLDNNNDTNNTNAANIKSHDVKDINNAQCVVEYIDDIMAYLKSVECRRLANPNYMSRQTDITAKMREILIDWLVEVHLKFRLQTETLYLTVNLIDRFLERRAVSRNKLQLVGCTCMLIASKYEEIYAPEINDFVHIADRAYTKDNILQMEQIILACLQFNLTVPSSYRFAQRFAKLACGSNSEDTQLTDLIFYLIELTLQDYRFLNFTPSQIATAATYLALYSLNTNNNSIISLLESESGYTMYELTNCMSELYSLANTQQPKYKAVRKKYSNQKFNQVAMLQIKTPFA